MATRFTIEIRPKDGSSWKTLQTDVEEIIIPEVGESLMIWDGYTTTIHSVSIAPTMDPMVYVRGRSLNVANMIEMNEVIEKAVREEGWSVLG